MSDWISCVGESSEHICPMLILLLDISPAAVSTNLPEIIHVEPVIEDEFRDTAEPELMALVDSPVKQKKKRNIKERNTKQVAGYLITRPIP